MQLLRARLPAPALRLLKYAHPVSILADQPNFFSGPYIERCTEAREEFDWLAAAFADPQTQFLLSRGTAQLLYTGPQPHIAFVSADHSAVRAAAAHQFVLLGWFRGRRCLLLMLPPTSEATEVPPDTAFEELRALSPQLDTEEAGLLAYARALSIWRSRQRHCGVCGAATYPKRAGHSLLCSREGCGAEYFPRLEPAVIVLVADDERALLGRQSAWPPGRYSTIAGFVEPGESLEDAVAREVMEETGVRVTNARYDSSQPWPFPASLMAGFHAVGLPDPVRVGGELEDARWFTRQDIRGGAVLLPPAHSISRRLIETWLHGPPPARATRGRR